LHPSPPWPISEIVADITEAAHYLGGLVHATGQLRRRRANAVLSPSLPATNAKRLRKGAKRRGNPLIRYAARWIASLRSQ